MKIYQIIAYDPIERYVCFVDYLAVPAGWPENEESAVRYALKWHPDLGVKKYRNVRFHVEQILEDSAQEPKNDESDPGPKKPGRKKK